MIPKDFGTIALRNAAERDVLALLLRTRSGFIVASRDADDPAAPRLDLLVIMPPSPAPPDPRSTSPGSELPLEDF
ncbi:MAG TPA: hypothetical protein VKC35_20070 [Vicinamibacterales bacterium]|nr:hypothetical protein [Vicinamibacterales bacterium]